MYKIMIVDDEGIVIDSLRYTIEKNFDELCCVEAAKTGRGAIELAETYRPDIVFMDIQIPGLNGIEAMKEIRSRYQGAVFIVLSAYDRFSYAKQAIDLGVLEYLTKPFNGNKIQEVIKRAMEVIDEKRRKMSDDLEIKEKMKTVIPMLENGLIHILTSQVKNEEEIQNYMNLLEINAPYGYMMLLEYGDDSDNGILTNPVGASVKVQKSYMELRETIGEYVDALIGAPMASRIAIYIPTNCDSIDYDERIQIIETMRIMVRKLRNQYHMVFKIGIGSLKELDNIQESYNEAIESLHHSVGSVTHIKDLPIGCSYEDSYPVELEQPLFRAIEKGNVGDAREYGIRFFEQMIFAYPADIDNIRMKILEFVLQAEHIAYSNGGMKYYFHSRANYLKAVIDTDDFGELENWFIEKMTKACQNVNKKQKEQTSSLVIRAKIFIEENFNKDLSLDDVSREVGVSPYYFSKLFKEETNINFIEHVTAIRMEKSKELLKETNQSIKEICINVGYSDPNYFSRIFKRCAGITPSEFRERGDII